MQIRDYDLIVNINALFEKKIIIFGAGNYGSRSMRLLDYAGIKGGIFCDRNESLKEYMGRPVITPDELEEKVKQENCMIIVGSKVYCDEIIEELEQRANSAYVCTWYGLQAAIDIHVKDVRFPEAFQKDFMQRKGLCNSISFRLAGVERIFRKLICFPHSILVYQPGKVGCQTVLTTLLKAGLQATYFHGIPGISAAGIEEIDQAIAYLMEYYKREKVKIVTLVRDPIARALSLFMQWFSEDSFIRHQVEENIVVSAYDFIIKQLDAYSEFTWFDREIKEVTGVDIYQYPFDKERGYAWIKQGNADILVLKTEQLNDNVKVLGEFVGKPDIELCNHNVGEEKCYKYIYKELKKRIRIPAEILDSEYKNNPRLDHFYTEEEKEKFYQKWNGKRAE